MISLQDELKIFKGRSVNTYYNEALDLVKDNNISKAIELMERSLEDIIEDVDTLNLIGLCEYMLCNFDKASLYWNNSLTCDVKDNRASHYIEVLNSDKFKNFTEYYNLSLQYIDKLKYNDAIELLFEINKNNKDLIEPYAIIGISYYGLQEYELAKKYLELALTKDIDNLKYLKYLNKIVSNIPLDSKGNRLNYKIIFSSIALLVAIMLAGFYQKYNKDIKVISSELDKIKSENIKLEEKFKKEVNDEKEEVVDKVDEEATDIEEINKELVIFEGEEREIFESAMEDLSKKQYSKSVDKFEYLIDTADNEDLISESTYFIAISYEEEKNYDKAGEYYNSYVDKYRERNYYDDSLYNHGLMLYEKGDIEASKEVLSKLKQEEPDSEFVNSKVKEILNN